MSKIFNAFLCNLIQTVTIYIFGYIIFKEFKRKQNSRNKFFIFLLQAILYTIIYLYLNGIFKSIAMLLSTSILLMLNYKINFIKSFFSSILFMTILFLPELFILIIAKYLLNVNIRYFITHFVGTIIGNIIINFIMIILIVIFKNILRKLINYNFSSSKKIIMVSIITFVTILIFFYKLIYKYTINSDILSYLLVIITLMVIIFLLFKEKINNETILKKYDNLLIIMKNYESDIDEQRIFLHETKNELLTIISKISDKEDNDKIIKYIKDILEDKKCNVKMNKYAKLRYLPSNGIKGFLYYKLLEANEKNIKVNLNVSPSIEKSFLSLLENSYFKNFIRILGVYLDNAIYAAEKSKDKKLGIEVYLIKGEIEFIISNSFNEEICIDKIGNEKYSTKGEKHGHGLLLVKYIIKNNDIFLPETTIKNNVYIQKLIIKKPLT